MLLNKVPDQAHGEMCTLYQSILYVHIYAKCTITFDQSASHSLLFSQRNTSCSFVKPVWQSASVLAQNITYFTTGQTCCSNIFTSALPFLLQLYTECTGLRVFGDVAKPQTQILPLFRGGMVHSSGPRTYRLYRPTH